MQKTRTSTLLHPIFLCSLSLLLFNDFYGKQHYHNWFTGKLSDVAGLIVLPLFLIAFFPMQKKKVLLFTALFFTWWKSPLSEPLIIFLNQKFAFPASRAVDYTDLLALPVLCLVSYVKPMAFSVSFALQKYLRLASGVTTIIALCATTVPYRESMHYGIRENEIRFYEEIRSTKTEQELIQHLKAKNISVYEEKIRYYPVITAGDLYYRLHSKNDSTIQWTPVPQSNDSAIYLRSVSQPFYVIPFYVLAGDTLKNIEFSILKNNAKKKKSTIRIEAFQTDQPGKYRNFYYSKQRKRYKNHLEKLFEE